VFLYEVNVNIAFIDIVLFRWQQWRPQPSMFSKDNQLVTDLNSCLRYVSQGSIYETQSSVRNVVISVHWLRWWVSLSWLSLYKRFRAELPIQKKLR